MSIWPWDWARDSADAVTQSITFVLVGLFVAVVGLAIIAKKLPMPGGALVQYLVGGIVTVLGLVLALGVI